jgi:hypothetical protein
MEARLIARDIELGDKEKEEAMGKTRELEELVQRLSGVHV